MGIRPRRTANRLWGHGTQRVREQRPEFNRCAVDMSVYAPIWELMHPRQAATIPR